MNLEKLVFSKTLHPCMHTHSVHYRILPLQSLSKTSRTFSGMVSYLSLGFSNCRSSWQWLMSARIRLQMLKWKLVLLTHLGTPLSWTQQRIAGTLGQASHLGRLQFSHRCSVGCTVFSRINEVAVLWHSSWHPSVGSLCECQGLVVVECRMWHWILGEVLSVVILEVRWPLALL